MELEPDLRLRALLAHATARSELGQIEQALTLLEAARDLVDVDSFTDVDRANVLFHIGQCRYRLSSIPTATALLHGGARADAQLRGGRRPASEPDPPLAIPLLSAPERLGGSPE